MKRKNAFTLIELMAVITILTVLSLIIIPIIDKNIKKSKENMQKFQIENIRIAAMNYYSDNYNMKPTNGEYAQVTLEELKAANYINDIKNPTTGRNYEYTIFVQLSNTNGNYKYSVCPFEEDCQN